jgi:hypothetical protein
MTNINYLQVKGMIKCGHCFPDMFSKVDDCKCQCHIEKGCKHEYWTNSSKGCMHCGYSPTSNTLQATTLNNEKVKSIVSTCCGAEVKPIVADEGTGYYECERCKHPCDAELVKEDCACHEPHISKRITHTKERCYVTPPHPQATASLVNEDGSPLKE